jgi:hypothetical protein
MMWNRRKRCGRQPSDILLLGMVSKRLWAGPPARKAQANRTVNNLTLQLPALARQSSHAAQSAHHKCSTPEYGGPSKLSPAPAAKPLRTHLQRVVVVQFHQHGRRIDVHKRVVVGLGRITAQHNRCIWASEGGL